jgi:phage gpG-like protein
MIKFEVDQSALQEVQERLSGLAPRVIAAVYRELKPLLYQSFSSALQKYFSGNAPERGPAQSVLTTRTGRLQTSVLKSFEANIDGATLTISASSDLPYAAIHEYGGFSGRKGPYKKKRGHRAWIRPRPYLRPALHDLEQVLPDLLEQAIERAGANTIQ